MDGGSWNCTGGSDQDHPQEEKCKKAKWLSEEDLQILKKRREAKDKGGKGRHIHMNAEYQRITRRDEKAFLGDQCKEIEENSRMGKIRDLSKKIKDTKQTFHAKMDTIKYRKGMDLREAKILRRGSKNLYRKDWRTIQKRSSWCT